MKFDIKLSEFNPEQPVRIGNVYPVRGGHGVRGRHMIVIMAITKDNTCLCMVIDREGAPVGVSQYGLHAMEDRMPIGFVPGVRDELVFDVVPL